MSAVSTVEVAEPRDVQWDRRLFSAKRELSRGLLRGARSFTSAVIYGDKDAARPRITRKLDELMDMAEEHEDWTRWRYHDEDERAGQPHITTPPFARESYGGGVLLSVLQMSPAVDSDKPASIGIEKIRQVRGESQTFGGLNLHWLPDGDGTLTVTLSGEDPSTDITVKPAYGGDIWQGAVIAIADAHKKFVR